MDIKVDFKLDMTKHYDHLDIAILICSNKKEYVLMTNKVLGYLELKTNPNKTGAMHIGFTNSKDPFADPISFIVLIAGYPIQLIVHELFHAARHYFKLLGKRINEDGDEPFAHLLEDLVHGYLDQCPGHLLPSQNMAETHRIGPSAEKGAR